MDGHSSICCYVYICELVGLGRGNRTLLSRAFWEGLACMRCLSLYNVDRSRFCACCVCHWSGQRREVGKNVYKTLYFEL